MPSDVTLVPLGDPVLDRLLAVAVAQSDPSEVMAPVAGPAGWTEQRRAAFLAYHRGAQPRSHDCLPEKEATFAVLREGEVVGALRLARVDDDASSLEVGLWLGREWRGNGLGRLAVAEALNIGRRMHARRIVARTSPSNTGALRVLRACGFVTADDEAGHVTASRDLATG